MKHAKAVLLLGAAAPVLVSAEDATPVQKVIELLKGMAKKGEAEMQAEKVQMAKYESWCEGTLKSKSGAIEDATERIETLSASIQKATADAASLGEAIDAHNAEIEKMSKESAAATKVREQEHEDFLASQKDYAEGIDSLSRAVEHLLKVPKKRKTPESLLELDLTEKVKDAIEKNPNKDVAYKSSSNGIIEMLKDLKLKFTMEKADLESTETKKASSHTLVVTDIQNQIESETRARDSKSSFKNKKLEEKASNKDTVDTVKSAKTEDTKYRSEVDAECSEKASDFKSRQELRQGELEAVAKAIEIMSNSAVSSTDERAALLQMKAHRKTVLALLRSVSKTQDVRDKLVDFLQGRATKYGSKTLAQIASKVAPVVNTAALTTIKDMLHGLVTKLQEEAREDQSKKGWCDTELASNAQTRTQKTGSVDELTSDIALLSSSVEQLQADVNTLTSEVAEAHKTLSEALGLRNKEKSENVMVLKEAKDAQEAVTQAMSVLKDFYSSAAKATAFIQIDQVKKTSENKRKANQPEIFDSAYTGMGGQSGGVVGMLEVIAADFARLESETSAQEEMSQRAYETLESETKVEVSGKETDIKHFSAKATEQKSDVDNKKVELEGAQKELDAANKYFGELESQCLSTAESHQEEVQRREEEIQSLKEALEMLTIV
eukprot:TRINITY_DN348_c0_g2_i1.p1 TRINITY_DN348_c0_g2~~TRINITY_DN348_c0_g2_i1.p1  ORF type:complete len:665 (+),score=214.21 TRINITY_DN348_c0_g2_i1:72-2066(+)